MNALAQPKNLYLGYSILTAIEALKSLKSGDKDKNIVGELANHCRMFGHKLFSSTNAMTPIFWIEILKFVVKLKAYRKMKNEIYISHKNDSLKRTHKDLSTAPENDSNDTDAEISALFSGDKDNSDLNNARVDLKPKLDIFRAADEVNTECGTQVNTKSPNMTHEYFFYLSRPLIYVSALYKFGKNSWIPYLLSLLLEAVVYFIGRAINQLKIKMEVSKMEYSHRNK
eukprot:CAMPEP_0115038872 /NCGR_PEP_ID=MMETSP0216-20121206/43674_1 /TAXON_ID=223996 /ORGANISM="Protocruzia adherens, Strain Boccale" /LENGTH=226 /DNA_ID=CAMNT_0002419369 /DNA_START=26 /DNA_END=705 /DNA_ORIENTATION=+